MKIFTDEHCAQYARPGHPERPARITRTLERLRQQKDLPIAWEIPALADDEAILRAHTPELLSALDSGEDFDADTPAYPGIEQHGRRSAGGALAAMASARAGTPAFSLLRPPGHHATRTTCMGFCYLNSIAIATLAARAAGVKRVAVYDFDVHHGNGTEDILLNQPGAAFASIHQFPCYPGSGRANTGKNCFNFPVAPATPRDQYRKILSQALDRLKQFEPELIAVSAGFDAYVGDPLAQETLEAEDYHWLGSEIRKLSIPAFSVLEGGYSDELPELILAYLKGWSGK
jgi:acetoin utilization deacetylase AcuC-like enzyme